MHENTCFREHEALGRHPSKIRYVLPAQFRKQDAATWRRPSAAHRRSTKESGNNQAQTGDNDAIGPKKAEMRR